MANPPTKESTRPTPPADVPTRVVIKFLDSVDIPDLDRDDYALDKLGGGQPGSLVRRFPALILRRMLTSVSASLLEEMVRKATSMDSTYHAPNLRNYFFTVVPEEVAPRELAQELATCSHVQTAYVDYPAEDPVVNPANDEYSPLQGYLDPAPGGVDAEYAWQFDGGDGAGQRLIDVERGWIFDHEDLCAKGAKKLFGEIRELSRTHGTSVLGVICAVDNDLGIVGIAPNVTRVDGVSYHKTTKFNAIMFAISQLEFGDVLLLECQADLPVPTGSINGPVEGLDAEFDAIRLATALGIAVVEAAGNGNGVANSIDLDTWVNQDGKRILHRDNTNADFRDSGAIMVAASSSAAPHTRIAYSTSGMRIDCYAWGENIQTCHGDTSWLLYTGSFGGTSGASAIVAGAALVVQGLAEAQLGFRCHPRQLRAILSDPANGTKAAPTEASHIGVMPNLRTIIDSVLQIAPDVYMRDHVGDSGDPHAGAVSSSPDIILLQAQIPNPQSAFGEGSGTENNAALGDTAKFGQPNYIYVRVRNRGPSPASATTATVFWSPVATLVTPDLWTLVGSVTIPNVPSENVLTVSDVLTWPQAQIPAGGHYCFVGLIGSPGDPAPAPADFLNWDNFLRFIRDTNNVTWRKFHVIDIEPADDPSVPQEWLALPFLTPGPPDRARRMRIEIIGGLPGGSRAMLEVPLEMAQLLQSWSPQARATGRNDAALIPVAPFGRSKFPEISFPTRSRAKLRLLLHIPRDLRSHPYEIAVRQVWRDQEVGRVTWRLAPRTASNRDSPRFR